MIRVKIQYWTKGLRMIKYKIFNSRYMNSQHRSQEQTPKYILKKVTY